MYVYMGHMRWQDIIPYEAWFWEKNKINLVKDLVTKIEPQHKTISTASGAHYQYDQLIIATGSSPKTLNIEGINLDGVTGLHAIQDLAYLESRSKQLKKAVIVGGGLIGVELAEMLHSRKIAVTHLVRENGFASSVLSKEESGIVNQHIEHHGIDLRLDTEIIKIQDNGQGSVASVTTTTGEDIECQLVGMAIGVKPKLTWLGGSGIEVNIGVLTDVFLKTNVPDIFAIGDCAELRNPDAGRKAVEPIWYTGRMMGETVAKTICGIETKYQPGIWFNSAKFFDIEYQSYGDINPILSGNQSIFFWKHKIASKSIRINYTLNGVIGFSALGIRLRQNVCHQWIHDKIMIEEVLAQFELAVFDAEFSKKYADKIRNAYFEQTGKLILKKANGRYDQVYRFLKKAKSTYT